MDVDSKYIEQVLQVYRENTWDDRDLADLPGEIQQRILNRARKIQAECEREDLIAV